MRPAPRGGHAMPCLAKPCPAGGTVCQLAAGRQTRKRVTCGLSKDDENCHSAVPHRVSAAPGNRQRKGGPPSAPFPTEAGSLARVCTSPQFGQALLGRRESRAERRRAVSEMIGAAPPPPPDRFAQHPAPSTARQGATALTGAATAPRDPAGALIPPQAAPGVPCGARPATTDSTHAPAAPKPASRSRARTPHTREGGEARRRQAPPMSAVDTHSSANFRASGWTEELDERNPKPMPGLHILPGGLSCAPHTISWRLRAPKGRPRIPPWGNCQPNGIRSAEAAGHPNFQAWRPHPCISLFCPLHTPRTNAAAESIRRAQGELNGAPAA